MTQKGHKLQTLVDNAFSHPLVQILNQNIRNCVKTSFKHKLCIIVIASTQCPHTTTFLIWWFFHFREDVGDHFGRITLPLKWRLVVFVREALLQSSNRWIFPEWVCCETSYCCPLCLVCHGCMCTTRVVILLVYLTLIVVYTCSFMDQWVFIMHRILR